MKSLLVIILFLLSLIALVAVLRSRPQRVAFVPVRATHSAQGRAMRPLSRPGASTVDLAAVGRELRFRQLTSRR